MKPPGDAPQHYGAAQPAASATTPHLINGLQCAECGNGDNRWRRDPINNLPAEGGISLARRGTGTTAKVRRAASIGAADARARG